MPIGRAYTTRSGSLVLGGKYARSVYEGKMHVLLPYIVYGSLGFVLWKYFQSQRGYMWYKLKKFIFSFLQTEIARLFNKVFIMKRGVMFEC